MFTITNFCVNLDADYTHKASSSVNPVGRIVITASGGTAPYHYSINGTVWQSSGTFNNIAPGNYTIYARDSRNCEVSMGGVVIEDVCGQISLPGGMVTVTQHSGPAYDGEITIDTAAVEASNQYLVDNIYGGETFVYSFNNGASWQSGGVKGDLAPGTYTVLVKGVTTGCTASVTRIVQDLCQTLSIQLIQEIPSTGNTDGSFEVVGQGGSGNYEYSIDGGVTYQVSGLFEDLDPGEYDVWLRDTTTDCIIRVIVEIENRCASLVINSVLTEDGGSTDPVYGVNPNVGKLIVADVGGGFQNYEYALVELGGAYGTANIFEELDPGQYTLKVKGIDTINGEDVTCEIQQLVTVPSRCDTFSIGTLGIRGVGDISFPQGKGQIIINNFLAGSGDYEYSLDGVSYTALPPIGTPIEITTPGTYTLSVRDTYYGCISERVVVIPNLNNELQISTMYTVGSGLLPSGQVIINGVTGGTGSYSYALDVYSFTYTNIITGVPAGTHTVYVQDLNTGAVTSQTLEIVDLCPLLIITNIYTSGDSIYAATLSGGYGNYEFGVDSPGALTLPIAGLSAGPHVLYVRDIATGCVAERPFNIYA